MKKKNGMVFSLLAIGLAITLLAVSSFGHVKEKPTCCKENMDQCPGKKSKDQSPEGMIWETLPAQFFSFTSCSY